MSHSQPATLAWYQVERAWREGDPQRWHLLTEVADPLIRYLTWDFQRYCPAHALNLSDLRDHVFNILHWELTKVTPAQGRLNAWVADVVMYSCRQFRQLETAAEKDAFAAAASEFLMRRADHRSSGDEIARNLLQHDSVLRIIRNAAAAALRGYPHLRLTTDDLVGDIWAWLHRYFSRTRGDTLCYQGLERFRRLLWWITYRQTRKLLARQHSRSARTVAASQIDLDMTSLAVAESTPGIREQVDILLIVNRYFTKKKKLVMLDWIYGASVEDSARRLDIKEATVQQYRREGRKKVLEIREKAR